MDVFTTKTLTMLKERNKMLKDHANSNIYRFFLLLNSLYDYEKKSLLDIHIIYSLKSKKHLRNMLRLNWRKMRPFLKCSLNQNN